MISVIHISGYVAVSEINSKNKHQEMMRKLMNGIVFNSETWSSFIAKMWMTLETKAFVIEFQL